MLTKHFLQVFTCSDIILYLFHSGNGVGGTVRRAREPSFEPPLETDNRKGPWGAAAAGPRNGELLQQLPHGAGVGGPAGYLGM